MSALEQQELDAKGNEHARKEKLRNVFGLGVRVLLVVAFGLIVSALVVLAWHYLGPKEYWWVSENKLQTISTVLFSGTLFVFLGLYIRDRV